MASFDLSKNRTLNILNAAYADRYAVLGACVYNLEGIVAAIRAAEAQYSPVMLLLFPWAITYGGSTLVHAAASAARSANVPVSVHLDHCQDPDMVRRAADIPNGFDSIMVDMSHYKHGENLRLTKELVAYVHERGIAAEAECGRIEGGEDGVAATADLGGLMTTVDGAREFVACGIDMLAPAFGNVHGEYGPRGIQLEYARLKMIDQAVGGQVRLILHGSDPFRDEHFEQCIARGITRVNINKGINRHARRVLENSVSSGKPYTAIMESATQAMQDAAEEYMLSIGSCDKA